MRPENQQYKDIENRSWTTRHQGPLLIHAARKTDPRGFAFMDKLGLEVAGPLHTGVILGQLDLGEIVRGAASIWALPSQHHWQMSAPVPAVRLLEAKGQQGRLFPAPPDWRRAFAEVDVSVSAR